MSSPPLCVLCIPVHVVKPLIILICMCNVKIMKETLGAVWIDRLGE